jgi:hypothetical protein
MVESNEIDIGIVEGPVNNKNSFLSLMGRRIGRGDNHRSTLWPSQKQ